MERSSLCEKISSSCWNHSTLTPEGYGVKNKPEIDQRQSTRYLDVFSSRCQITANIMKGLNIPGLVACINSSNPQTILRQEHS